jgi:hypothetical protein
MAATVGGASMRFSGHANLRARRTKVHRPRRSWMAIVYASPHPFSSVGVKQILHDR